MIVGDGSLILLGQATMSPRWDIPKGIAEPGEPFEAAAARELLEETGLVAAPSSLTPLGLHDYLPRKQLALFAWRAASIDPSSLRCTSMVRTRDGRLIPELSRFALLPWDEALTRVGKNMARILQTIGPERALGSNHSV